MSLRKVKKCEEKEEDLEELNADEWKREKEKRKGKRKEKKRGGRKEKGEYLLSVFQEGVGFRLFSQDLLSFVDGSLWPLDLL